MFKRLVSNEEKVLSLLYRGLIFIVPLFFLPWTAVRLGMDNYNKQYLIWLFVPILSFLFFFRNYRHGELKIKRSIFDWSIIAFITVCFFSSLFSVDKFSSFWGGGDATSSSFFLMLFLAIFYFLSIQLLDSREKIIEAIKILFISLMIVIAFAFFIYIGLLSHSQLLSNIFYLAAGQPEELGMLTAFFSVLLSCIFIGRDVNSFFFNGRQKLILKIFLIISWLILLFINLTAAWLVYFICTLFYILIINNQEIKKEKINYLKSFFKKNSFISFFLAVSLILSFINFSTGNSQSKNFSQSLRAGYAETGALAFQSIKKAPIFGFGSENFSYAFSLLRSNDLNKTDSWNLRFDKSPSYFFEIIILNGLAGLTGYLAIFITFIFFIIKTFRERNNTKDFYSLAFVSSAVLCLFWGQLFFSVNVVLLFFFSLFLSFFAALYNLDFRRENLAFNNKDGRFIKPTAILIFFLWFVFILFGIKYWYANFNYQKGLNYAGLDKHTAINYLEKAVRFNQNRSNYQIVLSRVYLQLAMDELEKKENADLHDIKFYFEKSITAGKAAVASSPNSVIAYENLGKIYRDASPYLSTAATMSIDNFNFATKLEPTNPVILTELGKIYAATEQYNPAEESFKKAVFLKDDYFEAKFNLAKLYNDQGRYAEALIGLADLETKYDDSTVFYEEGRAYFNQKQFERSIEKLKRALATSPNHANALYSLASAYSQLGEKKEAIYYFKRVLQLNPENSEVKKNIEDLEK